MKNAPGYPLPAGELGEDDIVCQLVYLPDRPEYWQALLGALSYMATWRAWERDDAKRGKDAAANWREAFECTMECWRMACLDDLKSDVAEILAIMQLGNACCDEQDITDGDRYTDRVEDGVGDVPQPIIDAGYATGTSDWSGFDDYKCMIAHVTIDQLEARLREIDEVLEDAGPYLAVAAALSAIIGVIVATGGLAIVFGLLAGVGTVSALYYALIEFGVVGDLADDVATNHEELACAIYNADGDDSALTALNDKIDELFSSAETLVLTNMNIGPTLKSLYAGRYDQQDIAEILEAAGYELGDFDCTCDIPIGDYTSYTDFEDQTWNEWNHGVFTIHTGDGIESYCARCIPSGFETLWLSTGALRAQVGLATTVGKKQWIHKIRFWYKFGGANGGNANLIMAHDGGTEDEEYSHQTSWTFVEETFDPPLLSTHPTDNIFKVKATSTPGEFFVDEMYVDFDAEDD